MPLMPHLKKLEAAKPMRIQNMICKGRFPKFLVSEAPKIRTRVKMSPTMPENNGV